MTRTFWITGMLVMGLGAGVAGMANANQKGPGGIGRISFEKLDINGDGKLTKAELESLKLERFVKIDANGDGMLSAEEMLAHRRGQVEERMTKRINKMISKRDGNGDGMLSIDELESGNRLFERVDTDEDGVVSAEEFAAAKSKWRANQGDKPARQ